MHACWGLEFWQLHRKQSKFKSVGWLILKCVLHWSCGFCQCRHTASKICQVLHLRISDRNLKKEWLKQSSPKEIARANYPDLLKGPQRSPGAWICSAFSFVILLNFSSSQVIQYPIYPQLCSLNTGGNRERTLRRLPCSSYLMTPNGPHYHSQYTTHFCQHPNYLYAHSS